jgi:16S rRNA (cytosine967-C5)-methyltransferase
MPVPDISPARRAAFRILLAVEQGQSHSDDLLRGKSVNALSQADRNLATTLVLGVLRWQLVLDERLKSFLKRPGAKLDPEVLIALQLGAFQLLYLDRIPAHAAIGESVEMVKQAGHRFASSMVNAVLRKLASLPAELSLLQRQPAAPDDSASAYPSWIVERWTRFYGADTANAICRHGQMQPVLSIRIDSPEIEAELIGAGIGLAPGELLACTRIVVSGDVTATAALREGRVRIQDEGSQLIAELAGCSLENRNRELTSILDACAAPGGKTLILAERNPHARILACESNPQRLEKLRERLAAHADRIECRLADTTMLDDSAAFDLGLSDVPCSGTGTLGRNPEIRHRLRAEDLGRHAERQRGLLRSALRAVRPGGRVVYSTCSLEPEENEDVVAAVLAEDSGARQVSLEGSVETLLKDGILTRKGAEQLRACLTAEGALRLIPGTLHTDGFFIALLQKTIVRSAPIG